MQTKHIIFSAIFIAICVLVIVLAIFVMKKDVHEDDDYADCPFCPGSTSKLGEICSESEVRSFKEYAISTDSAICANVGKSILDENGNAIDAAISVLLCMGVTIPESLGLGGGSLILVYNKATNQAVMINAREEAPKTAYRDMYNSSDSIPNSSSLGPQSIAVPGELAGYWHLYEKYGSGNITWERLFRDAIDFAENGFPVGQHLQNALEQSKRYIYNYTRLKEIYINPSTGNLYRFNETFKQPQLAKTLREISKSLNPKEYFYTEIAKKILDDLKNDTDFAEMKPIYLTEEDFQNYQIIEQQAYKTTLKDGIQLFTAPLPGSGLLLSFMLKIMLNPKYKDLYPQAKNDFNKSTLFYHRLMETFKFAYSRRMHLGDDRFDDCQEVIANLTSEKFIDEIIQRIDDTRTFKSNSGHYFAEQFQPLDHGTAHLSVLDKWGNVVSASTTVNLYFGSKVYSPSTGLILNDEMDDFNIGKKNSFDLPVAFANTVQPGKRPLSSMSPSVFLDQSNNLRLVIGASGGSKITTAVALVALRNLWMEDDIKIAIDASRVHHQLFPTNVENEECFPKDILESLREKGHEVLQLEKGVRGAVVMAISRLPNGTIRANSDYRKGGTIAGV